MSEIFNKHEECEEPRVVLIEGKPGMGKTTYCKKVVFDWASGKHASGNCFTNFALVLLIKCRDFESGLWEAIEDQLLPREVGEDQRERFFDFILHNQSNVLLVLDGLDEVSEEKLPMFSEIIQGRMPRMPNCRVIATARHEAGVKVRIYCNTLLEIEGFTEEDVNSFIRKFFRDKSKLAEQLIAHLCVDYTLYAILTNPLNTALLCLVYEDLNGVFPESRTKLYMEIVECVLRRYRTKQQLPENGEDLVKLYESELRHLGSIALKGLLEDNLDFDEKELGEHKASDLPGFGFLSVQPGGSRLRPTRRYGFLHKTFQEFFAAFHLTVVSLSRKKSTKRRKKNVDEIFGSANDDELTELVLNSDEIGDDGAAALGQCLKHNTSLTTLELNSNKIGNVGATDLGECLKCNKSLTRLELSGNEIGNDGTAALGECLKHNTSLTTLILCSNKIGDVGATALGECLKHNTSLTTLILRSNKIGDVGATALGECLKHNTSLTTLNLNSNKIGDVGAAALVERLEYNKSLTRLELSGNKIGNDGTAALVVARKCHPHLKIFRMY
nr:nucleotide-binding oligomerization domain-containing protein 2-like [Pocillopora verrucosa]